MPEKAVWGEKYILRRSFNNVDIHKLKIAFSKEIVSPITCFILRIKSPSPILGRGVGVRLYMVISQIC